MRLKVALVIIVIASQTSTCFGGNKSVAMDRFKRGNAYFKAGNLQDALIEYRAATDNDPKLGIAHYALCMALGTAQRYEEAIAECDKAIKEGASGRSDSSSEEVERGLLARAQELRQQKGKCDDANDGSSRCSDIGAQFERISQDLANADAPRFVSIFGLHPKGSLDPTLASVERIVLLPVILNSAGAGLSDPSKVKIKLKRLRDDAQRELLTKRYQVEESDDNGEVGKVDEGSLIGPSPAWVKRLGPADSRWVMIVAVDLVISGKLIGTAAIGLNCYLMDKQSGTVIWNGSGQVVGDVHPPGTDAIGVQLDNLLFPGLQRDWEEKAAVVNLLAQFPSRPKK